MKRTGWEAFLEGYRLLGHALEVSNRVVPD